MAMTMSESTSWRHCSAADGEAFTDGGLWLSSRPSIHDHWRRCPDCPGRALVLCSSCGCRGHRVATSALGYSRSGVGSDLSLSLLQSVRGVRGSSHGVYVHHAGEAGTPRTTKSPPSWRAKCQNSFTILPPALLQEHPRCDSLLERA
jgi:hypothetical protein